MYLPEQHSCSQHNTQKSVQLKDCIYILSMVGAATSIIFVATKHIFCHDKSMRCCNKSFVTIKICLSRQKYVCPTKTFVMTKIYLSPHTFCHDKLVKHTFVTTKYVFCHNKHMFVLITTKMIQLPPMITINTSLSFSL